MEPKFKEGPLRIPLYKGTQWVWYFGPNFQDGLFVYDGQVSEIRHRIRTPSFQNDGFWHIFEVDECDIRPATEAEIVLFRHSK